MKILGKFLETFVN